MRAVIPGADRPSAHRSRREGAEGLRRRWTRARGEGRDDAYDWAPLAGSARARTLPDPRPRRSCAAHERRSCSARSDDPTVPSAVWERGLFLKLRFAFGAPRSNLRPGEAYPGVAPRRGVMCDAVAFDMVVPSAEGTEKARTRASGEHLRPGTGTRSREKQQAFNTRYGVEQGVRRLRSGRDGVGGDRAKAAPRWVHKRRTWLTYAGFVVGSARSICGSLRSSPTYGRLRARRDAAGLYFVTQPSRRSETSFVTDKNLSRHRHRILGAAIRRRHRARASG